MNEMNDDVQARTHTQLIESIVVDGDENESIVHPSNDSTRLIDDDDNSDQNETTNEDVHIHRSNVTICSRK